MNLFLTSSPYLYQHDPATLNPANEFVDRLKAVLPHRPKTLFIASDPANHDMTMAFIHATKDAFGRAGVPLGRCTALDWRNARWAYRLVAESQFIILVGGHVPTQNAFFQAIHLREILRGYTGVVMGISAGSMNCANIVYAQPEESGESLDPHYRRYLPGLGLTDLNILPHYQQVKDNILDGRRLYKDITYADSMGHTFYAMVDGSYIYNDGGGEVLFGEAYLLHDGILEQISGEDNITVIW